MIKNPKISFLCPSYNHEKYVADFIRSILAQTIPDFELIIVDDCSADNNVRIIEQFDDSRIRLVRHPRNMGINAALQTAISYAQADVCVFIASDDMLMSNYAETVSTAFQTHPDRDVVYSPLQLMNNEGDLIDEIYRLPPEEDRYQLLRDSFLSENKLLSPGMAVRTAALKGILPLSYSLCQCQDWDIHNRLLTRHDVLFLNTPVVLYRRSDDSVSHWSSLVSRRYSREISVIMDYFLTLPLDLIKKIFPDSQTLLTSSDDIPFFLAMQAMHSKILEKQQWGYQTLLKSCYSKEKFIHFLDLYHYYFRDFIALPKMLSSRTEEALNREEEKCRKFQKKLTKYRKLFKITLIVAIVLPVLLTALLLCVLIAK